MKLTQGQTEMLKYWTLKLKLVDMVPTSNIQYAWAVMEDDSRTYLAVGCTVDHSGKSVTHWQLLDTPGAFNTDCIFVSACSLYYVSTHFNETLRPWTILTPCIEGSLTKSISLRRAIVFEPLEFSME